MSPKTPVLGAYLVGVLVAQLTNWIHGDPALIAVCVLGALALSLLFALADEASR